MNQEIRISTKVYQDFARNFMGRDLSIQDRQEIALKAMAVVEFLSYAKNREFSSDDFFIKNITLQAEKECPRVFIHTGVHTLSQRQLIDDSFVFKMIRELGAYIANGLWTFENKKAMVLDILFAHHRRSSGVIFENGVYELCRQLLNNVKGDTYLPCDESLSHSIELAFSKTQVFAELDGLHTFAPIVHFILGNITYQDADPILRPSYVKDGKLQTFDKGFLAGAWGLKIDPKTFDNGRFVIMGKTYQHYLIQHLFAQVSKLALVFVPQNALTSNVKGDVEFREWLVNQKHLKAVLSLPSGLILNSGANCSLMIFDLTNEYEMVRFISLKDSDFIQRNQLTNIEALVKIINSDGFENVINVHHNEITNKNFVLDPERYVLNSDSQKAVEILSKYQTVKLGEIADIIRPFLITNRDEGDEGIVEIQGGDLPSYGYIATASKQSFVSRRTFRGIQASQVQAGDIIMTIRGSTGKVGLVSQALIDSSDLPMVVGQTGVIIRPDTNKVNPVALYMQLHSQVTQSRLALLSVGGTVSGLSIVDLKEFDIAQLSKADEQMLIENFEKQCLINDEILQKQQMLAELSERFWL